MRSTPSPSSLDHLRLLASAIAGRPVEVTAAATGQLARTDGLTIHLPADAAPDDAVRMLAVQASLIAAGSLAPAVLAPMVRRPALARRYLMVEGHRAMATTEAVLPRQVQALIAHAVARSTSTPEESLAAARRRGPLTDPPAYFGTLDPRQVLDAAAHLSDPDSHAREAAPSHRDSTAADLRDLEDEDGSDDGYLGNLLTSPVGGGGPLGRLLARMLSSTRTRGSGGPPGADAPTHITRPRPGAGRRAAVVGTPSALREDGPAADRAGTTYPEWDVRRRRYREGWCTVVESDPAIDPAATVPLDQVAALRRPLAPLGLGRMPTGRQRQGDDIDIDAAVEAQVDGLAGHPHDDAIYIESQRRHRDLAILVLLDVSGSAGEPGLTGRSVHEHQQGVAAGLLVAAHGLGDRVALYGFNSRGRTAVQLLRVKAFDDHLDGQVLRRLGGLAPAAYTRLGAAIRHGTEILDARGGTPRRLLVVLSDGFAYDHGYEGRYGEADARRALAEARRRGVGSLCLSVGAAADPAALRRVFGSAAHATVPLPAQLPRLIGPLFQSALQSAEAQRRVHLRKERARQRISSREER